MVALIGLLAGSGCRTPPVDSARRFFHSNRVAYAADAMARLPGDHDKDKVLLLMERGMIHQAGNDLEASTADWLRAVRLLEINEPYSLSRGAASLLVNDRTLPFRGFPYERTLLRAMLAHNFLIRGQWQSAAVEARNIIAYLENLNGFPDDAFSRYVAGFSLEMANDREGAALQYRMANDLLEALAIDDRTGRFHPAAAAAAEPHPSDTAELIVFVLTGRGPSGMDCYTGFDPVSASMHAAFYDGDRYLGRSHVFNDTATLLAASQRRILALQTAKDVTRIAVKETIVQTLLRENEGLGFITGVLLYSLEQADTRRWETLPRLLQVARFPCPADLDRLTVVYRGGTAGWHPPPREISGPFSGDGRRRFLFCRDTPPYPP